MGRVLRWRLSGKWAGKRRDSRRRRLASLRVGTPQVHSLFRRVARGSNVTGWHYVESTTSITGRPALRLGSHCSRNNLHQRIHPVGTQMRATV
jgi:hypothetical protein